MKIKSGTIVRRAVIKTPTALVTLIQNLRGEVLELIAIDGKLQDVVEKTMPFDSVVSAYVANGFVLSSGAQMRDEAVAA